MERFSHPRPDALTVLVVDDSSLMRRLLCDLLRTDSGLQPVGEASDGREALQLVTELSPDVILLDIEMPGMDGLEFLRRARLMTTARIIVISSLTQPGSPQQRAALALGASDILPKTSGALSLDVAAQAGTELLAAIHRCAPCRLSSRVLLEVVP